MANTDRPRGFNPAGLMLRQRPYDADASEATGIFIGDIMMLETDGYVAPASDGDDITKLGSSNVYNVASTVSVTSNPIMINDHPDQLYEAQDDGSETVQQNEVGQAADHIAGSGSTTTLLSGHEIALSSAGTSVGGFVLLGFVKREDNDETAHNADWICQLNSGEGLLTVAGSV